MLHVILVILKVIGIILLCILGLLLLLVSIVLFIPIRYDAELSFYSKANGWARVHWLLHIISGNIIITDNKPRILIRLFGIPIKDSAKPKKEKKSKQKLSKKKSEQLPLLEEAEENAPAEEAKMTETARKEAAGRDSAKEQKNGSDTLEKQVISPDVSEKAPEMREEQRTDSGQPDLENRLNEPEESKKAQENPEEERKAGEDSEEEKESGFDQTEEKAEAVYDKLENIWEKIGFKTDSLKNKAEKIKEQAEKLKQIWDDEGTKRIIVLLKVQIKKIIHHIRPHKVELFLHYGMEDPAATGELLGWFAVFMVWYQDAIKIQPDFQKKVTEGELKLKGHIRFIWMVIFGIRLLLSSDVRALIKKIRK